MKITVEWVLRMRRNDSGRQGELGWRVDLGHDDVNRAGGDPFLSLSSSPSFKLENHRIKRTKASLDITQSNTPRK